MDATDDELIRRHGRGERGAFEALVGRHQAALYGYLLARAGDRPTADDLFQEVFLEVLDSLGGYEPRGRFRAWLFAVARHRTADLFRRIDRRRERPLDPARVGPCDGPGPDERAESAEERARLAEAVDRLRPKLRETYLLRIGAGLTFREIAESLDCPLGTVLTRMRYALDQLRQLLVESKEGAVG